ARRRRIRVCQVYQAGGESSQLKLKTNNVGKQDMINIKKQALCGAVVTGLASLVAVDALAASSFALEEIVVTAQKRSESAQDVGMSITALSGDSLKASGVVTTSDLGKVVPGFVYTKTPRGTPTYAL